MADRGSSSAASTAAKPIWVKQAEEARLKSEAETAAAAKAAFEATFKAIEKSSSSPVKANPSSSPSSPSSNSDDDRPEASKPVGPVDPSRCTAAGAGIGGGSAGTPSSFVVVSKDSDGRRVSFGGASLQVRVSPGVGVGGADIDGIIKDTNDGSYTVTYGVPKRGNYMVHVELNGKPIMGSPFPVFFSAGVAATPVTAAVGAATTAGIVGQSPYPNLINQTMPNMPNYAGSVSGAFPGLMGMIQPGSSSAGVVLPGIGASLGEVCREYLNGRCVKTDCKLGHPPHGMLMAALAAATTMGTLSQAPMAPSAAAMAAAQAIMAAQALQAHAAQAQRSEAGVSSDEAGKADALKKTVQVSNLSPLLTVEQLKQLFGYCGTVVDCTITDSKHFAYIEYSKSEEATAALALNNMDVGGRPLNVEMAKSLPSKSVLGNSSLLQSSLPLVMQQAVQMQQMQFQQALLMQQTMASQQAANRAATMKSASDTATAIAAEITKKLKADGVVTEEIEVKKKSRSPSPARPKSRSKSRSPIKYRRSRRSRSFSPPVRHPRDRRSRSPVRSRHYPSYGYERRSYRDARNGRSRDGRRESERSRDHYSSSRRNKSRSASPDARKSSRARSPSPKHHRESISPRRKTRAGSKSPRHHRGSGSSPRRERGANSRHSRRSRSRSPEGRHRSRDRDDKGKSGRSKTDHRKSEKGSSTVIEPEAKDSTEKGGSVAPSAVTPKKDSKSSDERAEKVRKDAERSKKSRSDDRMSDKTDASSKDRNLLVKDLDYSQEKKATSSPKSKSYKRGSVSVDDEPFLGGDDSNRHEKSDSGRRRREEIDHSKDDYEYRGEDQRVSSRSKRSSKHHKSAHSSEVGDRDKPKRSKSGYSEAEKNDVINKEAMLVESGGPLEIKEMSMNSLRSGSLSAEAGALNVLIENRGEIFEPKNGHPENTNILNKVLNHVGESSAQMLGDQEPFQNVEAFKQEKPTPQSETLSVVDQDHVDDSSPLHSKIDNGRTDPINQQQDSEDCDFEGSREDESNASPSKLSSYEKVSIMEDKIDSVTTDTHFASEDAHVLQDHASCANASRSSGYKFLDVDSSESVKTSSAFEGQIWESHGVNVFATPGSTDTSTRMANKIRISEEGLSDGKNN
ncbi:hypothetical protein QJS10_CPB04g01273 [Acorus calamus]|uniref:RRM domain-containing protein n=1 Tax=Acorus calamus TaxID=4465 RepID=A0AAV9F1C9_ACOCL|nr:hypothetical protein QJS10_CPB04g01273 [Acorus calamus]